MPYPLFKCENICKHYSDASSTLQILNNVNFSISAGEKVAILGASGSGKSTLLHILGTLDTPDSGDVFYNDQSLFTKSKRQQALFRNTELGFVYQFHHLLPEFSAAENVAMPLFIKGDNRQKSLIKAKDLLARVGLQDREQHRPHQLSGGERQRVAIARALINQPAMIFADEPTGNLDDKNTASIYDLISDINKEFKTSFLLVTHDVQLAKKMDRIMYLESGQLRMVERTNMSFSLAWIFANKFRQSKQQSGFISFVSASSTAGIGLGCFVLVLLLSVMNGFEKELRNTLLSYIPHAEFIAASPEGVYLDEDTQSKAAADPRVLNLFAYTKASGLLQNGNKMKSVELQGVDDNYLQSKPAVKVPVGAFADQENGIILGAGVVTKLGLAVGDKVQLLLPAATNDLSFAAPKVVWLTLLGEISLGGEADDFVGIMKKQTLSFALGVKLGANHIEFQLADPFAGRQLIREYGNAFNQAVYMSDWTLTNGHLYQDIQLVRTVVYITLTLVICVACFNIVSSLVMSVKEKTSEIAMLKTMGAQDSFIRMIFVMKGMINGIYGASIGTFIGVIAALYLNHITDFIEAVFGFTLLADGIYFINYLPSDLQISDVIVTYIVAVSLCVIATIYPASKAANIEPATALQ